MKQTRPTVFWGGMESSRQSRKNPRSQTRYNRERTNFSDAIGVPKNQQGRYREKKATLGGEMWQTASCHKKHVEFDFRTPGWTRHAASTFSEMWIVSQVITAKYHVEISTSSRSAWYIACIPFGNTRAWVGPHLLHGSAISVFGLFPRTLSLFPRS